MLISAAPIASCEARYGGVVDTADMRQFGAYTDCFGTGPFLVFIEKTVQAADADEKTLDVDSER